MKARNTKRKAICRFGAIHLVLTGVLAFPATGAELIDRMPAGTLLYISWPGTAALAETAKDTAWVKLLADPRIGEFREHWGKDVWPAIDKLLRDEMAKDGKGEQEIYELGLALLSAAWEKPTAIAIANVGPGKAPEGAPDLDGGLVIRAGADAAGLVTKLNGVISAASPSSPPREIKVDSGKLWVIQEADEDIPLYYGYIGDDIVACVGDRLRKHWTGESKLPSLTTDEHFTAAAKAVKATAQTPLVYVNFQAVFAAIEKFEPMAAQMEIPVLGEPGGVRKLLQVLGIDKLRSFAISTRPRDAGFETIAFLHAPGIGKGGGLFGNKPLTDEDLKLVPKRVYFASVDNFDVAAMFEYLRKSFEAVAPDAYGQAMPYLHGFEQTIGFKIHDDLLASFADTWALYDSPAHAGPWFVGFTVIGELRPGNRLQSTLEKAVEAINALEKGARPLTLDQEEHREQTIHIARINAFPVPIAPAWAEYKGRWIFALAPQVVQSVLDHQLDAAPSLLDNPDFQNGRKFLPPNCSSIGYTDAVAGMKQNYSTLLSLASAFAPMIQEGGVPLDPRKLPTTASLTRGMFGTVAGMLTTPEGVLSVQHSAYPISFSGSTLGAAAGGMAAGTMVPALARARMLAKRSSSAANLNGIGKAIYTYASAHDDRLPANLDVLVKEGLITQAMLKSPSDDTEAMSSYQYVPGQNTDMDPRNVLAYERTDLNDGEGVNVLFMDSHVEFMMLPQFEAALAGTKARIARERK